MWLMCIGLEHFLPALAAALSSSPCPPPPIPGIPEISLRPHIPSSSSLPTVHDELSSMAKRLTHVKPRLAQGDDTSDTVFDYLREVETASQTYSNFKLIREASIDREGAGVLYSIGQVFRHKKFGYRGVVYGWTALPQVDVSQWDGVQGLTRGIEQPFYFMLPDR
jgi:hypothetical protein